MYGVNPRTHNIASYNLMPRRDSSRGQKVGRAP